MEKLIIAGREFSSRLFLERENSIPMKSWSNPSGIRYRDGNGGHEAYRIGEQGR